MRKFDDEDFNPAEMLFSTVSMLIFGLMILFFLIAIDRQKWFELRPASGTAQAMSFASDRAPQAN